MALINGSLYVFVEKEDVKRGIEAVTHPVEKGIDITRAVDDELQKEKTA